MRIIILSLLGTTDVHDAEVGETVSSFVDACSNYDIEEEVFNNMVIEEAEVEEGIAETGETGVTVTVEVIINSNSATKQLLVGATLEELAYALDVPVTGLSIHFMGLECEKIPTAPGAIVISSPIKYQGA